MLLPLSGVNRFGRRGTLLDQSAVLTVATFAGAALFLAGCQKQTAIEPSVQTVSAGTVETIQPDTPDAIRRP